MLMKKPFFPFAPFRFFRRQFGLLFQFRFSTAGFGCRLGGLAFLLASTGTVAIPPFEAFGEVEAGVNRHLFAKKGRTGGKETTYGGLGAALSRRVGERQLLRLEYLTPFAFFEIGRNEDPLVKSGDDPNGETFYSFESSVGFLGVSMEYRTFSAPLEPMGIDGKELDFYFGLLAGQTRFRTERIEFSKTDEDSLRETGRTVRNDYYEFAAPVSTWRLEAESVVLEARLRFFRGKGEFEGGLNASLGIQWVFDGERLKRLSF